MKATSSAKYQSTLLMLENGLIGKSLRRFASTTMFEEALEAVVNCNALANIDDANDVKETFLEVAVVCQYPI